MLINPRLIYKVPWRLNIYKSKMNTKISKIDWTLGLKPSHTQVSTSSDRPSAVFKETYKWDDVLLKNYVFKLYHKVLLLLIFVQNEFNNVGICDKVNSQSLSSDQEIFLWTSKRMTCAVRIWNNGHFPVLRFFVVSTRKKKHGVT